MQIQLAELQESMQLIMPEENQSYFSPISIENAVNNVRFQNLFFTTKGEKDLRNTLGIFFTNSQGFWLQLHPQKIGQFSLQATLTDIETGELVGSYQTTLWVERDVIEQLKVVTGLLSIIAGPVLGAVQFFLSGIF